MSHHKIDLTQIDPSDTDGVKREDAEIEALHDKMSDLQERLYAEGKQSLLIILQAMDAGGKDGTIKKVFAGLNPQGVHVTSFKSPTAAELGHDFLWRVHPHVPAKGYIGIFNRSHYEDVLIVRVNELAPREVWEARYDHINAFESLLVTSGTRILKFFLHISKDEQRERLQKRLDDPEKRWKFSLGDLPVRERWDDYMAAYSDALTRCNTDDAPWHVIPADKKWYRDYVIARTIIHTLEKMNPQFPAAADLAGVVIPA